MSRSVHEPPDSFAAMGGGVGDVRPVTPARPPKPSNPDTQKRERGRPGREPERETERPDDDRGKIIDEYA